MLFYFDTDDGERRYEDRRGLDLGSVEIACREAVKLVRELAHVGLRAGSELRIITATVRNAAGVEIHRTSATLRHRTLH